MAPIQKKVGRKPGAPKTGGRKKGTPNKVSASVKEAIEAAFDEVGGAAYLVSQAYENPVAFMSLIGRVIPKDVSVKISALSTLLSEVDGTDFKVMADD